MIFRNDDINPNTDFAALEAMYRTIRRYFPAATIISAVNLLAQSSKDGSAYAAVKPVDIDFAGVDKMLGREELENIRAWSDEVVSHGLAHLDHRALPAEMQEFSIRASCSILGTKVFVPPFLRANGYTRRICEARGITIFGLDDEELWLSLDRDRMDPSRKLVVFHSWTMTPEIFASRFEHLPLP